MPLPAARAQAACGYPGPGGLSFLCVVLKSPSPRLSPRICGQAPICAQAPYSHRRPIFPGALFALPPCLHRRPYVHRVARRPIRPGALFTQAPYLPRRPICPGALIAQAPICAQPPYLPRRPYVAICALIKVSHVSDRLVCRDYDLILCTR